MATQEEMDWLHSMIPAAQAAQRRWGVPASISLAQCILESGWGASELAREAHNFFGIKAHHLNVPDSYIEFPTAEYEDGLRVIVHALFEKYFDAADSFSDHAMLLAQAARYARAMAARTRPLTMAAALQQAGYSTNPSYAQELVTLMHDYDLLQYDTLPPAPAVVAKEVAA